MSLLVCMLFCLVQSGTIVFLIVRFEKERRELCDRLMARDLRELRIQNTPVPVKGRLQRLKEDWCARKAAKEIEKSEDI